MNITDVRVRCVAKEGKIKAVVSITIDEEFVVHDIKVIEGEKGLFIAMPSRKATDGEYRDIAHPINSATRERVQNIILEKYEQVLARRTRWKVQNEIKQNNKNNEAAANAVKTVRQQLSFCYLRKSGV